MVGRHGQVETKVEDACRHREVWTRVCVSTAGMVRCGGGISIFSRYGQVCVDIGRRGQVCSAVSRHEHGESCGNRYDENW